MIDQDIRRAETLPGAFYRDESVFAVLRDRLLHRCWHYVHGDPDVWEHDNAIPVTILPGLLDEPLVLTRDQHGPVRAFGNVCTHRGNLLVEKPGRYTLLRCRYHGRCFGIDGICRTQPGFDQVDGFPGPSDDLTAVRLQEIGPALFACLEADTMFDRSFQDMLDVMSWFPFERLQYDASRSRDFQINAHWALYVDNYLEGYHVAFVHPGLRNALDATGYEYRLFATSSLQIGRAKAQEPEVFDLPQSSQFSGERIFAFYWWIFPNIMWNFYPWGVSLNVVEPISLGKTNIRFRTFVLDGMDPPDMRPIHQTELEDEAIVEQVQHGIASSFYKRGRYAPQHELAVHHFHVLLSRFLQ